MHFTGRIRYYYFASNRKWIDPTFITNPLTKQIILSQDVTSMAPVIITKADGTPITGNVYSETFHFFNQGNLSIKPEHILEPLTIVLTDTTGEIIDYKIVKESRSVSGLRLVPDSTRKNRIGIEFKILEEIDGFTGQIIYSSSSNPVLQIKGAIEGAPRGFSNSYKGNSWLFPIKFSTIVAVLVLGMVLAGGRALIKYLFKEEPVYLEGDESEKKESTFLNRRYQLIIRNERNFAEKTSLGFTYSKLIVFSFLFFITVFLFSLLLTETVIKGWFDPKQPPAIELPETLLD